MAGKMRLSDLLKADSDSHIEDESIGSRASQVHPTKIRQIYGPPILEPKADHFLVDSQQSMASQPQRSKITSQLLPKRVKCKTTFQTPLSTHQDLNSAAHALMVQSR